MTKGKSRQIAVLIACLCIAAIVFVWWAFCDCEVEFYRVENGTTVITSNSGLFNAAAISADSKVFVCAENSGPLLVIDMRSGKCRSSSFSTRYGRIGHIWWMSFGGGSRYCVATGDTSSSPYSESGTRIYDVEQFRWLNVQSYGIVSMVRCNSQEELIALAQNALVEVVVVAKEQLVEIENGPFGSPNVTSLDWSDDGRFLAIGTEIGHVKIYDMGQDASKPTIFAESKVNGIPLSIGISNAGRVTHYFDTQSVKTVVNKNEPDSTIDLVDASPGLAGGRHVKDEQGRWIIRHMDFSVEFWHREQEQFTKKLKVKDRLEVAGGSHDGRSVFGILFPPNEIRVWKTPIDSDVE